MVTSRSFRLRITFRPLDRQLGHWPVRMWPSLPRLEDLAVGIFELVVYHPACHYSSAHTFMVHMTHNDTSRERLWIGPALEEY